MNSAMIKVGESYEKEEYIGEDKPTRVHRDDRKPRKKKWSPMKLSVEQFLTCVCGTASLAGFLYGYSMAASAMILVQDTFVRHFCVGQFGSFDKCFSSDIDEQPHGWVRFTTKFTALLGLGCLAGSIISPWISDMFGRRRAILIAAIIYTLFTGWVCGSYYDISILTARFFMGVGIGLSTAVSPMYIAELAPPHLRGGLCGLMPFSLCMGMLVAGMIGEVLQEEPAGWRYTMGAVVVPGALMIAGMCIFPESPRWVMAVNGPVACTRVLRILRQTYDVSRELESIHHAVNPTAPPLDPLVAAAAVIAAKKADQLGEPMNSSIILPEQESVTPKDWGGEKAEVAQQALGHFFEPRMRRRLLVACGLQFLQQCSGIVLVLSYGSVILRMVGIPRSMSCLIFLYILNTIGTLVALRQVDTVGRRSLLLQGAIGTCVANLGASITLKIGRVELNNTESFQSAEIGLSFIMWLALFVFFFSSSYGLIPWIYTTEIFPLRLRASAVGLANVVHALAFYCATYLQALVSFTTLAFTYAICGGLCFLGVIFIYYNVPETAQLSIEEMDKAFETSPTVGASFCQTVAGTTSVVHMARVRAAAKRKAAKEAVKASQAALSGDSAETYTATGGPGSSQKRSRARPQDSSSSVDVSTSDPEQGERVPLLENKK